MKETTPVAMPPCFEKWCQWFDDVFTQKVQKREFRHPSRGIIGRKREKESKKMPSNAVGVNYHQ